MPSFLDRWEEVDHLLEEALDLPPDERPRFLDASCAGDAALRRHLERLLGAASVAQEVLDAGAGGLAGVLREEIETPASLVGQKVGPYRLVRELGVGGMGTVYLAGRADGLFTHQVALKLVRRDRASAEVLRRFRHERQLLASLQHPNIARLYDGGVSSDGLPYLVMEYVEGMPITDYCDAHRLSTRARLRLFCTVCRAVQHAHQNLIVHRDLKPSNILVTADPDAPPEQAQVKLLDFGIAKFINPDPSGLVQPGDDEAGAAPMGTLPLTRTGVQPMTLEYASPEQIRGEAVTTASDVYALGVILYELLTGVRPYRLTSLLQHEVARVILEQVPTRPSTALTRARDDDAPTAEAAGRARATTPDRLKRQLRGDLDNIALKALAKEPGRRYGTVAQFMEDLDRHLDGRPVRARPDTLGYRAGTFVRRHRRSVGAVLAVVVLVASLTGFYTARLAAERDRATQEAARATQIKDFVLSLFDAADPDQRATASARALLDEGTARIEAELAGQPVVQAEMMTEMALLYEKLGGYARADTLLQAALAIRRGVFGDEHPLVADALYALGVTRRYRGRYDEADSLHRLALAQRRRLLDDDDPALAESTNELGLLAALRSDYATAERMHRETLARRRADLGFTSLPTSASLVNLALAVGHQNRRVEATTLLVQAMLIRRAHLRSLQDKVARLNRMRDGTSDPLAWERLYQEALALDRQGLSEEHLHASTSALNFVADQSWAPFAEAESLMYAFWNVRKDLLGADHPRTLTSQSRLALILQQIDKHAEAAALLGDLLARARTRLGAEHPEVAFNLGQLGRSLHALGRQAEAEAALREALRLDRRLLGEDHPQTADDLIAMARVLHARHRLDEAEALFRDGLERLHRTAPGQPRYVTALVAFGDLLHARSRHVEAEAAYRESVKIQQAVNGERYWRTAEARSGLGRCLADQGRFDEAEAEFVRSHALLADRYGPDHAETRAALQRLADLAAARRRAGLD